MIKPRMRAFAAAAAVAGLAAGAGMSPASAATATTVSKAGAYQFSSNYTDDGNPTTPFVVSNSPLGYAEANQKLAPNGVNLTLTQSGTQYASSGVIVDLGKLSSLFSDGSFVPPKIVGSSNLTYDLYFDTNGNGTYFGWRPNRDPYAYVGLDGDNAACMGAPDNASDTADFTCFTDQPTTPPLAGSMTMESVQQAFQSRTDGGTTNPEVWAYIGIQSPPFGTGLTGYVASVDGRKLVAVAPPPVLSHGHVVSVNNTRAVVAWGSTQTRSFRVTINGPGPINGRSSLVTSGVAAYAGLNSGSAYRVTIQPLVNGMAAGKTGVITFKTTRT